MENRQKVRDILEVLVVNWPKKEYWVHLSGIYGELDNEPRQLASYESAYDQGLLERGSEQLQLANLFLQAEVPYKAAQVIEKGVENGSIETDEQVYRLLSQAWQASGEFENAIAPLKSAAALSGDGDLDVRLAQSYLSLGRYSECITSAQAGLNRGGLRDKDAAYEYLGMCQVESKEYESAKTAFRNVIREGDERAQGRARGWIRYIDVEQARIQQINESIAQLRQATAD